MPESMVRLVDPAPELAAQDLSVLVWEDSLDYRDYATTSGFDDGRDDSSAEESADLDAELAMLLAEERRAADPTSAALDTWTDEAIVAEAARLERVARFAAGRGLELVHELAGAAQTPPAHTMRWACRPTRWMRSPSRPGSPVTPRATASPKPTPSTHGSPDCWPPRKPA